METISQPYEREDQFSASALDLKSSSPSFASHLLLTAVDVVQLPVLASPRALQSGQIPQLLQSEIVSLQCLSLLLEQ